jgi:hypothetical protein
MLDIRNRKYLQHTHEFTQSGNNYIYSYFLNIRCSVAASNRGDSLYYFSD